MVKDYVVELRVVDSHVYNFDANVVDIIYGLQNYDRVILDLMGESPDFKELGIQDTIEKIISTYGIEYGRIVLKTGNMIETTTLVKVETENKILRTEKFNFDKTHMQVPEPNKGIQKHFGIFIGRGNYARLGLASYLDYFYSDLTVMSYHCEPRDAFHKSHIGLNELLHHFGVKHPVSKSALNFITKVPVVDELQFDYPITNDYAFKSDIINMYNKIFADVVCETMFSGDTFGMWTEKTKRPVLLKTPFIVFGPRGYLNNLNKMGYKTFGRWWNESYDYSEGFQRIVEITQIIDRIAKMQLSEIKSMYDDMSEVLNYNRELAIDRNRNFRQMNYDEFKKQFSVCR